MKWPGPVTALWGPPGDDTSPWRILLTCVWDEKLPRLAVCGLNPSTATPTEPDPTCVRWLGMAQRWGFGGLVVANLYPLRATSPKDMQAGRFAIAGHEARIVGVLPPDDVRADLAEQRDAAVNACEILLCCWGGGGPASSAFWGSKHPRLTYLHRANGHAIHVLARLKGVEVSKLRPRDWWTGEFVPLPADGRTP